MSSEEFLLKHLYASANRYGDNWLGEAANRIKHLAIQLAEADAVITEIEEQEAISGVTRSGEFDRIWTEALTRHKARSTS